MSLIALAFGNSSIYFSPSPFFPHLKVNEKLTEKGTLVLYKAQPKPKSV